MPIVMYSHIQAMTVLIHIISTENISEFLWLFKGYNFQSFSSHRLACSSCLDFLMVNFLKSKQIIQACVKVAYFFLLFVAVNFLLYSK